MCQGVREVYGGLSQSIRGIEKLELTTLLRIKAFDNSEELPCLTSSRIIIATYY